MIHLLNKRYFTATKLPTCRESPLIGEITTEKILNGIL